MVKVEGRKIKAKPNEVLVGNIAYPKFIDVPVFPDGIDTNNYVLNTWDEGYFALSGSQKLKDLKFDPMTKEALGEGQFLARARDVTPLYREVNRALRREGVMYSASGILIEGERLEQVGNLVNNTWNYLNDRFVEGSGFLGLDVTHLVGMDGNSLLVERQPLDEFAVDCWADVQGEMNPQGYFTQRAPVQKFEKGKTIYQYKPVASAVVVLSRAYLYPDWEVDADPRLGCILRAEGTPRKLGGGDK
jgi:hypothetical protein